MGRNPPILRALVVVALLLAATASQAAPVYRIMPLGDSITFGQGGGNAGYRGPLYTMLSNAGYSFQYVGSVTSNSGSLPTSPLNQTHQEGHPGYVITNGIPPTSNYGGITDNLGTWLGPSGADPNIILLMIGTNCMGGAPTLATSQLDNLVSMISNKNTGLKPAADLIVAKITPINGANDANVVLYNAGVAGVVAAHKALGENVSLVDMYTPLNKSTDLADALHPNDSGYQKMATAWYNGIKVATLPEPSTLVLLGLAGVGLFAHRQLRRHPVGCVLARTMERWRIRQRLSMGRRVGACYGTAELGPISTGCQRQRARAS